MQCGQCSSQSSGKATPQSYIDLECSGGLLTPVTCATAQARLAKSAGQPCAESSHKLHCSFDLREEAFIVCGLSYLSIVCLCVMAHSYSQEDRETLLEKNEDVVRPSVRSRAGRWERLWLAIPWLSTCILASVVLWMARQNERHLDLQHCVEMTSAYCM